MIDPPTGSDVSLTQSVPPLPHLTGQKEQRSKRGGEVQGRFWGTTLLLVGSLVLNSIGSYRKASKMPPSGEKTLYLVMTVSGGVVVIGVLICAVAVLIRRLSEQREENAGE